VTFVADVQHLGKDASRGATPGRDVQQAVDPAQVERTRP